MTICQLFATNFTTKVVRLTANVRKSIVPIKTFCEERDRSERVLIVSLGNGNVVKMSERFELDDNRKLTKNVVDIIVLHRQNKTRTHKVSQERSIMMAQFVINSCRALSTKPQRLYSTRQTEFSSIGLYALSYPPIRKIRETYSVYIFIRLRRNANNMST